jgi:DNA-binding response OmpR family regulator
MQGEEDSRLRFNGLEIDLLKRQVTRDGTAVRLTSKEFELLEYFMRNPHRVLSKMQLGTRVWDIDYEVDSNVIEVYVSRLRKKIDAPFNEPLLHTVIGAGYIFSNEPPAA